MLSENKINYGGKVTLFLGNKHAAMRKSRFTEYDLNRSFGYGVKNNPSYERGRAEEIMSILETADVFIDFHQTMRPSQFPFYIFSMHEESYYWAQAAGVAKAFITRKPGSQFSDAGMCSDEFMRASLNKVGITLELGEQGFHKDAENYTKIVILRSLKNMNKIQKGYTTIKRLARKNCSFEFFETRYREPFKHPKKKLKEGFCNFDYIQRGDCIGEDEEGKPLFSKETGYILFPKYPATYDQIQTMPLSGELFVLAQKLNIHPLIWC